MGEVYRNSSCNISVSGFANGQEGFMLPQRRSVPTPIVKAIKATGSYVSKRVKNTELHMFTPISPAEILLKNPLFTRAWTLQEQLLVRDLSAEQSLMS